MYGLQRIKIPVYVCVLLFSTGFVSQSHAQQKPDQTKGWDFTVGFGVQSKPNYTGDDDSQVVIVPTVSATDHNHWTISYRKGVQYTVNPRASWQWGLALAPSPGRDSDGENALRLSGDGTDDLIGLGDIESSAALRLFTEYTVSGWSLNAEARTTFHSESQTTLSLGLKRSGRVETKGPPLILIGGITLKAGDQNTLTTLVGVTAEQSALSNLAEYSPASGVMSVGLSGTVVLPLSQSLRIISTLSIEQLGSELADSSLISERGDSQQVSVGIFLSYRLGAKQASR